MSKIYVPDLGGACYVVQSTNSIRNYHTNPTHNSSVAYTDYLFNSHYIEMTGTQNFGSTTVLPQCLNRNTLTDNYLYRNDISDIMIVFVIISIFCFYLPIKIFMRLFKKGGV